MNMRKLRQKQKKYNFINDTNYCCYSNLKGYADPTAARAIRNESKQSKVKQKKSKHQKAVS